MDNLLEILVPLIFAAIYFFGNVLSERASKAKGEKQRPDGRPQPSRSEQADEAVEAAERQRRIREEIRRKIAERRGQSGDSYPGQPEPAPVFRRSVLTVPEPSAPPVPAQKRSDEWDQREEETVFAWDDSGSDYQEKMQTQLRQIEETQRKAEALRKKSRAATPQAPKPSSSTPLPGSSASGGPVRDQLLHPGAARAAFIYGEVFGPPVALREPGPVLPAQR